MNKKLFILAIIIVIAVVAVIAVSKTRNPLSETKTSENNTQNINTGTPSILEKNELAIKEFAMTSFTEFVDGKPKPQYSLKEITVKKGDLVRIKITVTSGMHDFKIDEFNVYMDTKELNKEYLVEFMADKVGEFIYYCTKPGHRQNGQWGTLTVTE